jgi:MFS family permease
VVKSGDGGAGALVPRFSHVRNAARVVLVFAFSYSVTQLVFGPLGDRFGKVRLISAALFGCAALSLLASVTQDIDELVAARVGWAWRRPA